MKIHTKVPYPEVLRRLLNLLELPITLEGFQKAAQLLRTREAATMRITSGPFAGCWNNHRINALITHEVLEQFPQLLPLIQDFRDEASDYSTLCHWLNDFQDDIAWLAGNRPWPCGTILPVKNISDDGTLRCGLLVAGDQGYQIQDHDTHQAIASFPSALEAALAGWKVD